MFFLNSMICVSSGKDPTNKISFIYYYKNIIKLNKIVNYKSIDIFSIFLPFVIIYFHIIQYENLKCTIRQFHLFAIHYEWRIPFPTRHMLQYIYHRLV